jgi:tetratricopeptide (TPR) repeat protein
MSAQDYGHLVEENPRAYLTLKAIEGDDGARDWLKKNRKGLYLFVRAFTGDSRGFRALKTDPKIDLEELFEAIADDALAPHLKKRLPDLHLLFEAVKGDADAVRQLERKKRKPPLTDLARVLQSLYENRVDEDEKARPEEISEDTAADMGCLIGDLHLKQHEYEKAVAAFTRAIENQPSVDAYEGRARAYRGLAGEDERAARQLRTRL